jgi:hypothetical protein
VVPFFKVTEQYSLLGPRSMPRRDLRSGSQTAEAKVEAGGELGISVRWGEPNAGGVQETLRVLPDGALEVVSVVTVAAGSERTRSIYRREDAWRPKNKWNPLAALRGKW